VVELEVEDVVGDEDDTDVEELDDDDVELEDGVGLDDDVELEDVELCVELDCEDVELEEELVVLLDDDVELKEEMKLFRLLQYSSAHVCAELQE